MTHFSERNSKDSAAGGSDGSSDGSLSPRRVAVALSYKDENTNAPRVVAAGKGQLAEAILASAFDNDIKVRTDPDLAAILASVDVGAEIPEESFVAVAEILSYLYRISPEKTPDMLRSDNPRAPDSGDRDSGAPDSGDRDSGRQNTAEAP